MRSFDAIRAEVLALFPRLEVIVAGRDATAATERTLDARDRLADGRLTVVVCGEFKRGKSKLLNALLDEPDLFPVDSFPATSVPTAIRYGEPERVIVTVSDEGDEPRRFEINRVDLADYVTEGGNPGNAKRVRLVEIETPNPKLASGLVFVDTPGVGGEFAEHTAVTQAFLPGADALVFVSSVDHPLRESELHFVRRAIRTARITDDVDGLLFVLTKIDSVAGYQEIFDNTRGKLAELTGRAVADVRLIPASANAKLNFLATGDAEALEFSRFPQLEEAVWAALGRRRARLLLGGALRDLAQTTRALLAPIEDELAAVADRDAGHLADLRNQRAERMDLLTKLVAGPKTLQDDLQRRLDTARRTARFKAEQGVNLIWDTFRTAYLYDEQLLNDTDKMIDTLNADYASVVGGLLGLVRTDVGAAVAAFSREHGITVESPAIDRLPDLPEPQVPGRGKQIGEGKRAGSGVTVVRGASIGGGVAATVFGLLGAVVGTVLLPGLGTVAGVSLGTQLGATVGTVVGGITGGWLGYRSSSRQVKVKEAEGRRIDLAKALSPAKEQHAKHVGEAVNLLFDAVKPAAMAELRSRIAQERESLEDAVRRLDELAATTAQERAAREARLTDERKPLDEMRADIERLAVEVDQLGGGATPPADTDTAAAAGTAPPAGDDGGWADE